MFTKPLQREWGHKRVVDIWWPKCMGGHKKISKYVDQTYSAITKTRNTSHHVLSTSLPYQRRHKAIMTARTLNASQHVLTKPIPSMRRHHPLAMPERTQNVSLIGLTKHLPWQWGHKMYLKLSRPNQSHDSEDRKCIWTCLDQTPPMPAKTQNEPQLCWQNPSQANENEKCIST